MDTIKTKRQPHQTSVSLPLDMAKYLDHIRDPDIPRSRFFVRLMQRAIELEKLEVKK